MQVKTRTSKYEIARILAAAMIILNHIHIGEAAGAVSGIGKFNFYLTVLFHMGGKVGSCLFVIVSAWFLSGREFRAGRIIALIKRVLFYGLALNLLFMAVTRTVPGPAAFLRGFSYWFPFAYVVMLCAIPLTDHISEGQMAGSVMPALAAAGMTAFWVLSLIFPHNQAVMLAGMEHISGSACFCGIYMITCFLKKRNLYRHGTAASYLAAAVFFYGIMYLSYLKVHLSAVRDIYSPLCLLCAYSLFGFCHHLRTGQNRLVNMLASATFGTYLIQCHNNFSVLWVQLFHYDKWKESLMYIPVCLATIAVLFACACIFRRMEEFLRI